jgi:hypothetical protein
MNASVEKIYSSSIDPSIDTVAILTNYKYSFSYWMNKPLLLIVIHNLVIGLKSNSLTMAFSSRVFMVSLKSDICKKIQEVDIQMFCKLH